jgi:hypothetical protein
MAATETVTVSNSGIGQTEEACVNFAVGVGNSEARGTSVADGDAEGIGVSV